MGKYYVYDTAQAPQALVAKHPNAAVYSSITLFVTSYEELTGLAPELDIVNLAAMGLNHPYDEEGEGLTAAQFDGVVDGLFAPDPPPTGAEVWISKAQADYLYDTRFKPDNDDGGV